MTDPFSEYLATLPDDRMEPMTRLCETIRANLPAGFEERLQVGMPSWVVPRALYPRGYHVDPMSPLPFLSLASQKRHIGLYHMGLYATPELLEWFVEAYPKHSKTRLDMGKSCIRFKSMAGLPYGLVGELCGKMTPEQWIEQYETQRKRAR